MNTASFGIRSLIVVAGLLIAMPAPTSAQEERERRHRVAPHLRMEGLAPLVRMQNLRFPRARIGVALGGVGQDEHPGGAYVQDVMEDSPADRAGLLEGDVIVAVDGHRLTEPLAAEDEEELHEDGELPLQRLMALARGWEPGDEVQITYVRDGSEHTVSMETEESEFHGQLAIRMDELGDRLSELGPRIQQQLGPLDERIWRLDEDDGPRVWMGEGQGPSAFTFEWGSIGGVELRTLNPALGRYFGSEDGVLVLDVNEDSNLGLQAGDVILSIGDRDVDDAADVRRILRSYDAGEVVRFQIMRDGRNTTAEGTVRD